MSTGNGPGQKVSFFHGFSLVCLHDLPRLSSDYPSAILYLLIDVSITTLRYLQAHWQHELGISKPPLMDSIPMSLAYIIFDFLFKT